ncbi:bacillithiol system protein YtxJ [Gillisia sp. Hel1_33_143]|uniref:bacillithiol system redox-active protein YtxJ n=1 Tax=Gillisia sp. Hel1_33_143 TaxID=1336796 RepID=UPI00087A584D|nr:bacillithiol system redox-active protein YtxJ [Gillisia sp. Hel1_33_143]SDS37461.1 bacillithiol system protein YtxJ [Gillisia sp. Hel1_33_143]
MGIFDKIFKSDNEEKNVEKKQISWIEIKQMEMLDEIVEASKHHPVAILKHSTSCGISRMVLRQFEATYDIREEDMKLYFLDLLSYREISNKIASRFNVPHQSPQLIVLSEGKVIYDASHSEISADKLKSIA